MDFVVIDFETANFRRESPCEIGLTFVENNQLKDTKSWLIKPQGNRFDYMNIQIHGITPEMVATYPEFDGIWPEISEHLQNKLLIAHNASFDMSVLRRTLDLYQLPYPSLQYACSYQLSKKIWQHLPSFGLKALCQHHNIALNHHRAAADSRATAQLALKLFSDAQIQAPDDIRRLLQMNVGQLYPGGYSACGYGSYATGADLKSLKGDPSKLNPESIFFGKNVVITGSFSSMSRAEAYQKIVDVGGIPQAGITQKTNLLVVGQQTYDWSGSQKMSSKHLKAIQLRQQGAAIEILSEEDFLENI